MPRFHSPAARIIGDRVRNARLAQGISMDDLSELSELSATSIGKIERGAQSPSAETLVRIATALEVDAGALISGLSPQDFGQRARQYTARDFIREQRAKERAALEAGDPKPHSAAESESESGQDQAAPGERRARPSTG